MIWKEIRHIARLVWQFADRHMPRDKGPFPDRVFLYFEGELDTDCETIEVVYFREDMRPPCAKLEIERSIFTQGRHFDRLIDSWMKGQKIPVVLQFGGSGKIIKTEGFVSDLKIVGSSESSRMICSILCEAKPFQ